jgi:hypothetical protein
MQAGIFYSRMQDDEFLIHGGKPGKYKMIPYGPPAIEQVLLKSL